MTKHDVTREQLIAALNDDLAREYQAIIAYVVYSQVLKGAQYMNIAKELEKHAGEELQHALTIAKQIDYLGGMPTDTQTVKLTEKPRKCSASISRTRATRLPTIASASGSARRWANTPLPKTSARSCAGAGAPDRPGAALVEVTVDAVVGYVGNAVLEPLDRELLRVERGVLHLGERLHPVDAPALLGPEGVGILHRLRVHRPVLGVVDEGAVLFQSGGNVVNLLTHDDHPPAMTLSMPRRRASASIMRRAWARPTRRAGLHFGLKAPKRPRRR